MADRFDKKAREIAKWFFQVDDPQQDECAKLVCAALREEARAGERIREALQWVWREGVCSGDLKDAVRDVLRKALSGEVKG